MILIIFIVVVAVAVVVISAHVTRPIEGILKLSKVYGSNGDHGVLVGDGFPLLKSHG